MAEGGVNDAMLREKLKDVVRHLKNGVYLSCVSDSAYAQAIIWASERIAELEIQTQSPETGSDQVRGLFFRLGYGCETTPTTYCEAVAWGQDRIRYLEQHLQELLVDIKKLELENENLSKTILTLSAPPMLTSLESDEEIHQQRRRERMLDEITLFLVRNGFHRSNLTMDEFGCGIRKSAMKLCDGINEADAKH